jgi:hypothetical protein
MGGIAPKYRHEKTLAARTPTRLFNQRPAWLKAVHQTLDAALAAACGWTGYRADLPGKVIPSRLPALNLQRAKAQATIKYVAACEGGACAKGLSGLRIGRHCREGRNSGHLRLRHPSGH